MDHWVEDHLQWRLMTAADADELSHLREQIEVFDDTMVSAMEHPGTPSLLFYTISTWLPPMPTGSPCCAEDNSPPVAPRARY